MAPKTKSAKVADQGAKVIQEGGMGACATFAVEGGVELGPALRPLEASALESAWQTLGALEACSPQPASVVQVFTQRNLLAEAVHLAFYQHYPLRLSPDVIWLTIAQGLANHVDQNAEAMRHNFVFFEGKESITVERDDFRKGAASNDWPSVFPEFAEKIALHIGARTMKLIECNFSTTTPTEKIASQVALMDTVQHYFSYAVRGGCGFPSITLTGTPQDWIALRAKAERLREFEARDGAGALDWWLDALLPVLDQFVAAAFGRPDLHFWRSLCNFRGGSGDGYVPITGWLQVFFPYLNAKTMSFGLARATHFEEAVGGKGKKRLERNPGIAEYVRAYKAGVNVTNHSRGSGSGCGFGTALEDIPPGLSSAPFTYEDMQTGLKHSMAFFGGVASLVQHGDGALEPAIGWAVLERRGN